MLLNFIVQLVSRLETFEIKRSFSGYERGKPA